jgi:hypothetical protein
MRLNSGTNKISLKPNIMPGKGDYMPEWMDACCVKICSMMRPPHGKNMEIEGRRWDLVTKLTAEKMKWSHIARVHNMGGK